MVLYATGFNAWNQLQFESPGVDEPDDIASCTCVLREDSVDRIRPFFSYTRVHDGRHSLNQYPSISSLLSQDSPSHTFSSPPHITQLVVYETGFAALSSAGQVWTWGDERYTACLGREPTDDSPAATPGPVTDLDELPTGPITKLAAGGYILAALTAGKDLYCWGHAGRSPLTLDNLSDAPSPVVIDDKDILDVAIGEAHMLVLTADRAVYVLGANTNGQLGLPGVSSAKTWARIDLDAVLGKGEIVTGVAAGPRNSFLMVHKQPEECQ
ncbi:E3 ubiquitin-protein ligase HERC2 [Parachaetomium inaequale]|uniref:E3 ubiquitin-protein ligase HERC2 n=1 Tax=Parachaetomium inaequale TaxID=2588326 RepID=A0AAN6SR15_9PEZI|nr:E3 ubiquitin-protein ligase HERC2 [Parachaetomium inaequale]